MEKVQAGMFAFSGLPGIRPQFDSINAAIIGQETCLLLLKVLRVAGNPLRLSFWQNPYAGKIIPLSQLVNQVEQALASRSEIASMT
jgi:hypothetical protein